MNLVADAPQWLALTFIFLLVAAALQDALQLRISNIIVLLVILAAIVAAVLAGIEWRLWQNLAVFAVLLLVGMPLFAAGKLGGGDVKLLAGAVLWFSIQGAFAMLVAVMISGGLLAIIVITLRAFSWSEAARRRAVILRPKSGIPYGVAIAAGTLLTVSLNR